jgi:malate dehydrogenase (oxaloacetate-decarboxylating)
MSKCRVQGQSERGLERLRDPQLNRGVAFTESEREQYGLLGWLPAAQMDLSQQVQRAYQQVMAQQEPWQKWVVLRDLALENETLFFRLAQTHRAEILPLIYTPTIGEVAQRYSAVWRPSRAVILHPGLRGRMEQILRQVGGPIRMIVATDGERVLGLGDQGFGGMAISQGKIALYTLFGGVCPDKTLPVMLDVGTNHEGLLSDAGYLGWRHPRLTGDEYDAFIEEFVTAVQVVFPDALLQWEDFGKHQARRILERYQERILSFNDDIQGTAAVTLAGILAGVTANGQTLEQQRVVIYGGGSAGLGIAERLMQYSQRKGGSAADMADRIFVIDRRGLLTDQHDFTEDLQQAVAKPHGVWQGWNVADPEQISLLEVIQNVHPTILIGVSAHGGGFHELAIREMARHCPHPLIFPLSNPTMKSEAIPSDLVQWTEGRCILATGSPFPPVPFQGRYIQVGQCNNLYIFPGLGMGCLIARARQVTESMLDRAAEILAARSPYLANRLDALFPSLEQAVEIAREIAIAVAMQAQQDGVAPLATEHDLRARLQAEVWIPGYPSMDGTSSCG